MGEKKHALRVAALARRDLLTRAESLDWSRLIQAKALQFPPYLMCHAVALYSPIQNEVETGEIRDHALATGKSVFFPRMGRQDQHTLELVEVRSTSELSMGRFGILEPTGETRLALRDQEKLVVFVPGIAFDQRGNRLGRGKAWYDKLINVLGRVTVAALAYDFQIVDEVPADEWDQRVHYIITERRVIDCRCTAAQSNQVL
jgi:5-formyltetrahydrofolate cyclo-ligase